jgi:large subunit ribosomal protein L32
MAVPKLRTSPARKRKRRSHHALSRTNLVECPSCGATKHPHAACRECGYLRPGLTLKTSGTV